MLTVILTAVLIRPCLRRKYLDAWGSIESTFIAEARFLIEIEHWPHPQWQPLWHAGTRFDYLYRPALPYGTAGYEPAKAYHAYTALFYCIGIAGVYWLVRIRMASRGGAWLAAGATALLSPSYLLLKDFRADGNGLRGCRARLRQPSWWPRLLCTTVYPLRARSLLPVMPDYQSRVEYRIPTGWRKLCRMRAIYRVPRRWPARAGGWIRALRTPSPFIGER
jgi:hypothetical protein